MKKHVIIPLIFLTGILLTAFAEKNQLFPTSLRLTVRDGLGNAVDSAHVTLYSNEEDYRNNENPVTETQFTNNKGIVKFKDLQTEPYFVDARKGDMSNDGGGVETQKLEKGKVNRVTIIIQ